MAFDHDFKNGWTSQGIFYSQYIASFMREYFSTKEHRKVMEQLKSFLNAVGCSERETKDILSMFDNGKLELEEFARHHLKST